MNRTIQELIALALISVYCLVIAFLCAGGWSQGNVSDHPKTIQPIHDKGVGRKESV
jgi:hypothetical protein